VNKNFCIYLVAPDVLHRHVKSISDSTAKNLHFQAPEIDTGFYIYIQNKEMNMNTFLLD